MSRNKGLDLLKTIAMLMVISLHVPVWNEWFTIDQLNPSNLLQYFIRLCAEGVPIFVMINGYLISDKKIELEAHLKKTLKLFILLLVWAIIISVICRIGSETLSFKSIVIYVLETGVSAKYIGVLWYLQALIALYLFFPILYYIRIESPELYKYFFIIVTVFSMGVQFLKTLFDLLCSFGISDGIYRIIAYIQKVNPIANVSILFYFMLGAYIKEYHSEIMKKKFIILLLGIIAWIFAFGIGIIISVNNKEIYKPSFNYGFTSMVFMVLALYVACSSINISNEYFNRFIESVGKNTLGIYLIHNIIIHFINMLFPYKGLVLRIIEMFVVFLLSYGIVLLLRQIPGIKKLITI